MLCSEQEHNPVKHSLFIFSTREDYPMSETVDTKATKETKCIYAIYPTYDKKDPAKSEELSKRFTEAIRFTKGAFFNMVAITDKKTGEKLVAKDKNDQPRKTKDGKPVYVERLVAFIPKTSLETAHPDIKLGNIFTDPKEFFVKKGERKSNATPELLDSIGKNYNPEIGAKIWEEKHQQNVEKLREYHAKMKAAEQEPVQTETQGLSR